MDLDLNAMDWADAVQTVAALNYDELRMALDAYGLKRGPVTASTVAVYQRLLLNHVGHQKTLLDENVAEISSAGNGFKVEVEFKCSGETSDISSSAIDTSLDDGISHLSGRSLSSGSYTPTRWDGKRHSYEPVYGTVSVKPYKDVDKMRGQEHMNPIARDQEQKNQISWTHIGLLGMALVSLVIGILFMIPSSADPYNQLADEVNEYIKGKEI